MNRGDSSPALARRLIGQGVALGGAAGLLLVSGMALFLAAFGSGRLPAVYVAVAVSGAMASFGLTRAERRFGLGRTALVTVGSMATLAATSWLLVVLDVDAGAGLALVLFSVYLQLGFVLIGAQVGQAFDVAQVKATFPRIVAGFAAGFMVSGLVANVLSAALGGPTGLLVLAAGVLVVQAALMVHTVALVQALNDDKQAATPHTMIEDEPEAAPLRAVLASPLVLAVFSYQLLSAMATHLVEFLLFDRAAARIETAAGLASFLGRMTIGLNLTDLVVLVLAGGWLMSRFGLRFGLGANPVLVTALMVVAAAMVIGGGSGTLGLLILLSVAHTVDITAADVATRTSVNATFQALPRRDRIAAQAFVEGVGVPMALGLVAVLILGLNWLSGGSVVWVVTATVLVCVAWSVAALVVFVRYRSSVVDAVAGSRLATIELDLDDPTTRSALVELGRSGAPAHASVVARMLAAHPTPERDAFAAWAVDQGDPSITRAALPLLAAAGHPSAATVAVDATREEELHARLAGVRALGELRSGPEHEVLDAIVSDSETPSAVLVAALGAQLRAGGPSAERARATVATLAASGHEQRTEAAQVIAASQQCADPAVLAALLDDDNGLVRAEAGVAFASLVDADQAAVIEVGTEPARWFRHLRNGLGPLVCDQAWRLLADAGRDQGVVVAAVIATGSWTVPPAVRPVVADIIDGEVERTGQAGQLLDRLMTASSDLGGDSAAMGRLVAAVEVERAESRRRLLDAVTLSLGRWSFGREFAAALASGDRAGRALALESLDLALPARQRAGVVEALTDSDEPSDGDRERHGHAAAETVRELATEAAWAMHADWLQACALMTLTAIDPTRPWPEAEVYGPVTAELVAAHDGAAQPG